MIIVCDTNILISAFIFPGGKSDKIFRLILSNKFTHGTSPEILTEVKKVLVKKFQLTETRSNDLIRLISNNSKIVYPIERITIIKNDPSDNKILECAVEAGAEFIVTGDKKHILPLKKFQDISIVSPQEFCEKMGII